MANPIPFVLEHPSIILDYDGATPVDVSCMANEVHTNVSQDETTVTTFCGQYTTYKPEVWDITLQGVESFGTDGLWTVLRPLVGQTVPFELIPDGSQPVSVDNPVMSGVATVKAFPFIDAAAGEASEYDVVLAVQGTPTFGIVAPVGTSSESASSESASSEPVAA
jgi:hypothetical protein